MARSASPFATSSMARVKAAPAVMLMRMSRFFSTTLCMAVVKSKADMPGAPV